MACQDQDAVCTFFVRLQNKLRVDPAAAHNFDYAHVWRVGRLG
jgi:hypothetical protein